MVPVGQDIVPAQAQLLSDFRNSPLISVSGIRHFQLPPVDRVSPIRMVMSDHNCKI
jgi:hypothetical protein